MRGGARYPLRIGRELRETGTFDVIQNPFDGTPIGEACVGDTRDMEDAITAAADAFGEMRDLPTHRRTEVLERTARTLEARTDELAELMAREAGKPIRFCRGEVQRSVLTFKLAAGEARRERGEVLPADIEQRGEGRLCLHTRVPRGPVAAISPFNFPLNLIAHKLAPAIAVGTSIVLKPPPQCPLTAFTLGEILNEAGLPDGALSIVHCAPETAQLMVEDPRLAVLSFTGSDAVGWKLKRLAGKKKVLLELGGNAPCIIDEGVDLDRALPSILAGAWAHGGQVCIKAQRIFVHTSLHDQFLTRFIAETRAVVCGDPLHEETVVGPLIEERHVARVLSWVDEAVSAGAKLHCGGEADGPVVMPTILTDVTPDMRVCKDEVFGPVTVVEGYERYDEALAACNAGRFGLQAGVFTNDIGRALQAYRELDYGGVMINDVPTFRIDNFPYGGTRDSGFGREGVRFAMEEMTEPKVLVMRGLAVR